MFNSLNRINSKTIVLFIGVMVLCILVGKGIAMTNPTVALGVAAVVVMFLVSFLSTEVALYILIFSMLLGPEIILGNLGGGSHLSRGVTLRLDDFLLVIKMMKERLLKDDYENAFRKLKIYYWCFLMYPNIIHLN